MNSPFPQSIGLCRNADMEEAIPVRHSLMDCTFDPSHHQPRENDDESNG